MSAGTGHRGSTHWRRQRITALANLPLMAWLLWAVVHNKDRSHVGFIEWLAEPANRFLMVAAIVSVFWHAALGTEVIAEDYISGEKYRGRTVLLLKAFFAAAGFVCVASILRVTSLS